MLNSNGSGKNWVKSVGPDDSVEIGAGGSAQLTVGPATTTIANSVTFSSDVNFSAGGSVHSYQYMSFRTLQNTTPWMTASQITISGTASTGNGLTKYFLRVPMRKAGSILGLTLHTGDGVVKSGSLSGTILVDNVPTGATLGMNTGSFGIANFAKDTYTFTAGQAISVQLTASATYLCEPDVLSASFMAVVDVEY